VQEIVKFSPYLQTSLPMYTDCICWLVGLLVKAMGVNFVYYKTMHAAYACFQAVPTSSIESLNLQYANTDGEGLGDLVMCAFVRQTEGRHLGGGA